MYKYPYYSKDKMNISVKIFWVLLQKMRRNFFTHRGGPRLTEIDGSKSQMPAMLSIIEDALQI